MRIVISTLFLTFATIVIIVALMNPERVTLVLWPGAADYTYAETPVGWIIFLSASAGAFFMGIVALIEGAHSRLTIRRLRVQTRKLQSEVETLRRPSLDFSTSIDPIAVSPETDLPEDEGQIAGV